MIIRTLTPLGWAAVVIAVLSLLLIGTCTVQSQRQARMKADSAAADKALADGRTASAQDASVIRDSNDAANQYTRYQVKEANDAIRRETNPAVRDADARRRLCQLNPGACAQ